MDELVSRQAAIDMMYKHFGTVAAVDVPDGKFWNQAHVIRVLKDEVSPSQPDNNSDVISREQAIDALENDKAALDKIIKGMSAEDMLLKYYVAQYNQVSSDINAIVQLPTIQPEIVRCEECKYHHQRICPIEKYFSLNGFCSRGKRREVTT